MAEVPDLLLLRLEALELDLAKVRAAVQLAQERGRFVDEALEHLKPCKGLLKGVGAALANLNDAMDDEPRISMLIGETFDELDDRLRKLPKSLEVVVESVERSVTCLRQAVETTVPLKERSETLTSSLNTRWQQLSEKVNGLREEVRQGTPKQRRKQWLAYHELLNNQARPMFAEYVDFLGGLTVRDTGLDDRVCDMTDVLLTRFKAVTKRSLPLPARQAALGNALDSVVLLGFPEWSIWGIPLVGHEVGLAYAQENDPGVVELIKRYVSPDPNENGAVGRTESYVQELLADAFATYSLGLAYACAAILLRLSPRHDEDADRTRPRDIERARMIKMTLNAESAAVPIRGGTFTDAVGLLSDTWDAAVRAHAAPADEQAALAKAAGPPPEHDWLDDFSADAVRHFESVMLIRPYNNDRWEASQAWYTALSTAAAGPSWNPIDDAVVDVLTAAWRIRLEKSSQAVNLANDIKKRWSGNRRGV
jgi:hypothetical protein